MNNQTNVWAWVIGIIVVVVLIGGIWWWMSAGTTAPAPQTNSSDTGGQLTGTVEVGSNATTGPAI